MSDQNTKKPHRCDVTFNPLEKLLARGTFIAGIAVGAFGIWPSSPGVSLAYVTYAVVSYFLLMRYTVCARCPHLFEANDCLFAPAPLVKTYVSPRSGPLGAGERFILYCAAIGTGGIPLFWLVGDPTLLVVYLVLTGGCLAVLAGHLCKKCQVEVCPMNRNSMFRK